MWLRLSDAGGAVSIPGLCDPWPKEKKIISSVSRYSTTSIRLRNKRKEGMKDERGIGFREEMKEKEARVYGGRWQEIR